MNEILRILSKCMNVETPSLRPLRQSDPRSNGFCMSFERCTEVNRPVSEVAFWSVQWTIRRVRPISSDFPCSPVLSPYRQLTRPLAVLHSSSYFAQVCRLLMRAKVSRCSAVENCSHQSDFSIITLLENPRVGGVNRRMICSVSV